MDPNAILEQGLAAAQQGFADKRVTYQQLQSQLQNQQSAVATAIERWLPPERVELLRKVERRQNTIRRLRSRLEQLRAAESASTRMRALSHARLRHAQNAHKAATSALADSTARLQAHRQRVQTRVDAQQAAAAREASSRREDALRRHWPQPVCW